MSAAAANTIRRLTDVNLQATHVLPAAGASVSTAGIDLGCTVLGPAADDIEAEISVGATPSLVDDKTIIVIAEDSADNASFAPIAAVGKMTQTGASSAGSIAAAMRFKFPPATRQYVRATATVLAAGGDNTAVSFSLKLFPNS